MKLRMTAMAATLALATALPVLSPAMARTVREVRQSAPAAASCTTTGYSKNCGGCVKISAGGTYKVKIPNTSLTMKGTDGTSGKIVCFAKVAKPVKSKKGTGVRVTSSGKLGTAKVKGGATIYLFKTATDALKKVPAISKTGIYQIVA